MTKNMDFLWPHFPRKSIFTGISVELTFIAAVLSTLLVSSLIFRSLLLGGDGTLVDGDAYASAVTLHGTIGMFFVLPSLCCFFNCLYGRQSRDTDYISVLVLPATIVVGVFIIIMVDNSGWASLPPLSLSEGEEYDTIPAVGLAALVASVASIQEVDTSGPAPRIFAGFSNTMVGTSGISFVIAALLCLDAWCDTSFFSYPYGSPLLYQHIFWMYGHPEVYALIFPFFGMPFLFLSASRVGSRLRGHGFGGYGRLIGLILLIGSLSFFVWGHHLFTSMLSFGAKFFFVSASTLITFPMLLTLVVWTGMLVRGARPTARVFFGFAAGFRRFVFAVCSLSTLGFFLGGVTGFALVALGLSLVHGTFFTVGHFHFFIVGFIVPVVVVWVVRALHWIARSTRRLSLRKVYPVSENTTMLIVVVLIGLIVAFTIALSLNGAVDPAVVRRSASYDFGVILLQRIISILTMASLFVIGYTSSRGTAAVTGRCFMVLFAKPHYAPSGQDSGFSPWPVAILLVFLFWWFYRSDQLEAEQENRRIEQESAECAERIRARRGVLEDVTRLQRPAGSPSDIEIYESWYGPLSNWSATIESWVSINPSWVRIEPADLFIPFLFKFFVLIACLSLLSFAVVIFSETLRILRSDSTLGDAYQDLALEIRCCRQENEELLARYCWSFFRKLTVFRIRLFRCIKCKCPSVYPFVKALWFTVRFVWLLLRRVWHCMRWFIIRMRCGLIREENQISFADYLRVLARRSVSRRAGGMGLIE